MNTRELHIALLDDLEDLFKDRPFKTPHNTMETPKTYPQELPPEDARSEEDPFPYIIVRLGPSPRAGRTPPRTSGWSCIYRPKCP